MPVSIQYGKGKAGNLDDHRDRRRRGALRNSGAQQNRAVIDPKEVRALGAALCSLSEMAQYFGVKRVTLEQRISKDPELRAAYQQGRGRALVTVRRRQVEQANNGNVQMLIWLGKNYLGQSDKSVVANMDAIAEDDTEEVVMRWDEELDEELSDLERAAGIEA